MNTRSLPVTQGSAGWDPVQACAKIHRLSGLERVKQRHTQRYLDRPWQRHRETGRGEAQRETQDGGRQGYKDSEEQRNKDVEKHRQRDRVVETGEKR